MIIQSRLLILLFLASLTANAILAGILIGEKFEERRVKHELEAERKVSVGQIVEAIPDLQKQKFRNANEWLQREVQAQITEIRQKREQSMQLLTAPVFDRKAFDATEDEIIEIRQSIFRKRKNMVGFLAQDLSLEDRQRLAKELARRKPGTPPN